MTDPRSLFGSGRQERVTEAFRAACAPSRKGGAAASGDEADGLTSSTRQRRTVGRALERIADGRAAPDGLTPWQLLQP